jgi:hypothetical protein
MEMGIDRLGANLAGYNDLLVTIAGGAGIGGTPAVVKLLDNGAGSIGVWAFCFKRGDGCQGIFQMPHGYVEGSTIYPHLHWFNTASVAAAATVIILFEYMWINLDGVKPAATVTDTYTYTAPVGNLAAGTMVTAQFAPVVGTGKTISSIFVASLRRGVDTHTDAQNIAFLGFDIHVNQTKLGTQLPTAQP